MSFRTNTYQQISITDRFHSLTAREQKALDKSWAKIFAEEIFPAIDEKRFRVLYSDNASRPNTPVNIWVGALIIKEIFGISDDEIVENLMLDPRYQYALHTTSNEEQPLSDKSLSRFRKRCYDYETSYGVDLYHDCITDLGSKIAKMMEINPRIKRMDSLMIAANIRRLSRIELLYTCVAKLVLCLEKKEQSDFVKENDLLHYCDSNDFNRVFYYSNDNDTAESLETILKDADTLLKFCASDFEEETEYQLLVRCLSEQTMVEESVRRLRKKEDGGFHSAILQNPSDPQATFRIKGGKEYRGYAANIEETVDKNGSVVTGYQYESNNYSDSQFLKDNLERTEKHPEPVTLVTDGAYWGKENRDLAREKNIRLVHTDLSGKPVEDILADFVFNEEGTKVLRCPIGHEPKSSSYTAGKSKQCHVSFARDVCADCPNKDQCKAKVHKRVSSVTVSIKAAERARQQRFMHEEEYKYLFRIRNGVETIMSILRKQYQVDRMTIRGKLRGKFFFGSKIGALNFRKLFNYRKGLGNYAPNPIFE